MHDDDAPLPVGGGLPEDVGWVAPLLNRAQGAQEQLARRDDRPVVGAEVLPGAILEVHRSNRDLLPEWLDAQGQASRNAFAYFDQERLPAVEKLLAADATIDRALWETRFEELAACLNQDAVQKHHLRWIEFLAHAVDIPQLVRLIRAAQ